MLFFKNYGTVKAKSLISALGQAIVKYDRNGATEAEIAGIEEKFNELNLSLSKTKQIWDRENKEYLAIDALYKQRLAAAEILQADPSKASALTALVSLIEEMQPEIEREHQEAIDAKSDMDQLEELVVQYAEKLKSARHTVEKAKNNMQRAEFQKERAEEMASAAATAAGLSQSATGLSTALDHMNKIAEQAYAEAGAATLKAKLLQPTKAEDDPDIKAALAAAAGVSAGSVSIQDRLAALKTRG